MPPSKLDGVECASEAMHTSSNARGAGFAGPRPLGAEPGLKQSSGLVEPGEELGLWPSAVCKTERSDWGAHKI